MQATTADHQRGVDVSANAFFDEDMKLLPSGFGVKPVQIAASLESELASAESGHRLLGNAESRPDHAIGLRLNL